MRKILYGVFFFPFLVQGATIILNNDSSYILNAEIRGRNQQILGQFTIQSQNQATWQDSNQGAGQFTEGPYTVIWTCRTGSEFGINYQVSANATVSAISSVGKGYCQEQRLKQKGLQEY